VYAGFKGKQVFDLDPGQAVADQGAEINIISRGFVLENKIPVKDLGTVGFRGLQMINHDTALSPSGRYILNDFIQRFIQGLADKSLMQEAISQNVLVADSLRSAFERTRRAVGRLHPTRKNRTGSGSRPRHEDLSHGGVY
ncbi:hypothetical protein E4U17_008140, partial [Claviceps sp. LM77 group G4]